MSTLVVGADAVLPERYTAEATLVFDADERARFLDEAGRPRHPDEVAWELLYRIEPELYDRLVAGERLHDGILQWLPDQCGSALEIGAGAGRLTLDLAPRCLRLAAVEPAAGLRRILEERLLAAGMTNTTVLRGFFDSLPSPGAEYDLVISCSAFAVDAVARPEECVRAMESRCAPGGLVVLVWPSDVPWLGERGFEHVVFEGPMVVEYSSPEEAVALARVFYPQAVEAVQAAGSRFVDFTTLGLRPPRDLCWKRPR